MPVSVTKTIIWPLLRQLTGALVLVLLCLPRNDTYAQSQTIGVGDTVRVSVVGQPDLDSTIVVTDSGNISFPMIGSVRIAGLDPDQAARLIGAQLENGGFIRDARVNVFLETRGVAASGFVTILGKVIRSGRFPLWNSNDGVKNVVELLAEAGGPAVDAADYLYLVRDRNGESTRLRIELGDLLQTADTSGNAILEPDDIVIVPLMDVFFVYGEVEKPGRYRLHSGTTVMQAISTAGGLSARGTENGLILNRIGDDGKYRTRQTDLNDLVQPGDVVQVAEAFF